MKVVKSIHLCAQKLSNSAKCTLLICSKKVIKRSPNQERYWSLSKPALATEMHYSQLFAFGFIRMAILKICVAKRCSILSLSNIHYMQYPISPLHFSKLDSGFIGVETNLEFEVSLKYEPSRFKTNVYLYMYILFELKVKGYIPKVGLSK